MYPRVVYPAARNASIRSLMSDQCFGDRLVHFSYWSVNLFRIIKFVLTGRQIIEDCASFRCQDEREKAHHDRNIEPSPVDISAALLLISL